MATSPEFPCQSSSTSTTTTTTTNTKQYRSFCLLPPYWDPHRFRHRGGRGLGLPGRKTEKLLQIFSYKDLEAATGGFATANLVGKGSHGYVYRGILRQKNPKKRTTKNKTAAVKRLLSQQNKGVDRATFEKEVRILSKLRKSYGVVRLLGLCRGEGADDGKMLLVLEFMSRGTLHDNLHGAGEEEGKTKPMGWALRMRIALQIAQAVLAVHSADVIHRDIKSANVLIDRAWNAKLSDFGLALCLKEEEGKEGELWKPASPPAGTLGYLDPEYTTPAMLSAKNDVFSYGVLLLEIVTGRKAFDSRYKPPVLLDWALPLIGAGRASSLCDPALPPPPSARAIRRAALLAESCTRCDSSSLRPSMEQVVSEMARINRAVAIAATPIVHVTARICGVLHLRSPFSSTLSTSSSNSKPSVHPRFSTDDDYTDGYNHDSHGPDNPASI